MHTEHLSLIGRGRNARARLATTVSNSHYHSAPLKKAGCCRSTTENLCNGMGKQAGISGGGCSASGVKTLTSVGGSICASASGPRVSSLVYGGEGGYAHGIALLG